MHEDGSEKKACSIWSIASWEKRQLQLNELIINWEKMYSLLHKKAKKTFAGLYVPDSYPPGQILQSWD